MRSMTGFGRSEVAAADAHIVLEIKTVNHRFLEIRTKLPSELAGIESALEKCIRNRLSRGYCTVHLTFGHGELASTCISEEKLTRYIRQLQSIAERTQVPAESLMPVLTNAPDLFEVSTASVSDDVRDACLRACEDALDKLLQMRESEGSHMTEDILARLDTIADLNRSIQQNASALEKAIHGKFRSRISELLSHGQQPDEKRVETEAAIFAEKADINEEINRLFSHIGQMRNVFNDPGPVGRRMDFLVQEMGREANTIASKSVLSEITHTVVSVKSELEKIRELIQNIE